MNETDYGEWRGMASAPRDGTRVLVEIRASEQGPAEVDVVRWARLERDAEAGWVSTESDPGAAIFYAEAELSGWMPLPAPTPPPRTRRSPSAGRAKSNDRDGLEVDGSGI